MLSITFSLGLVNYKVVTLFPYQKNATLCFKFYWTLRKRHTNSLIWSSFTFRNFFPFFFFSDIYLWVGFFFKLKSMFLYLWNSISFLKYSLIFMFKFNTVIENKNFPTQNSSPINMCIKHISLYDCLSVTNL